jgi:hypothetical protein
MGPAENLVAPYNARFVLLAAARERSTDAHGASLNLNTHDSVQCPEQTGGG